MLTTLSIIAGLALLALVLGLTNRLPSRDDLPPDPSLPDEPSTIAMAAAELAQEQGDNSALYLITNSIEALAMRLAMVRRAERSIDAQYYIWEDDLSGRLLLAELVAAADRGLRVRLLIDDNPTAGLDAMWQGVDAHPNISVRIFNPLVIRKFRPANYLFDFFRLNRRMHNKSFTIDSAATLVGGRNVGDEYFGAADKGLFIDVDALAVGAVVPDVVSEFERYWNSTPAYPAERILNVSKPLSLDALRDPQFDDPKRAQEYLSAVASAIEKLQLNSSDDDFVWAPVRLVADHPDKALNKAQASDLLATQIEPLIAGAKTDFDLVSGYFVPGEFGTELLTTLADNGVTTRVATNSIQVTDVPVVHAGYVPYRKDLLRAGVELFEARPTSDARNVPANVGQTRFSGGGESVHAKTFAIDQQIFFVGSFNFDPRSARLNCEMGFIVESPTLARGFGQELDHRLAQNAYQVELDETGDLAWATVIDGKEERWEEEPGTSLLDRAIVSFLSILPIEWML